MTKEELIARLGKYEWNDVEFKKAQRGVPESAYETVSAFSNTGGGYLVFGVRDANGKFEIVGVIEVDKVQNDFLSVLRSKRKLNRVIKAKEDAIEHEGKTLLVFHIPEAHRREKPIYLNGDIRKTFIRRGGGDEQCTQAEIERMLRDAADTTYDCQVLVDLEAEDFYDPVSVGWYRRLFQEKQGGRHADLTDLEFLNEWGFVVEAKDALRPTRGAVLLFGKGKYVRQILPRCVVDYQRIDVPFGEWSPEKRWDDRMVIEENIVQAWQVLVEKYFRLAERPFSIDATTLRRHDDPPDYISFREAAINLLIHQDYGDYTRKPVIKIFLDRTIFWNPGDAFATVDQLLDPTEKEVRNPVIVSAFRRIGLSDQAGTGIRSIIGNWRQLGYIPPEITNNKSEKTFELVLLKEVLLTEDQRLFQAQLGVHLTDQEAAVFAFACRAGAISLTEAKSVTNGGALDTKEILERLVVQRLLRVSEVGEKWELAEHLKGRYQLSDQDSDQPAKDIANLVTDQPASKSGSLVTPGLTKLSDHQRRIIRLCEVPRTQASLMSELGLSHRTFFRRKHLEPLLQANLVRMTHPEEPNHPKQAYVVTEAGLKLLATWKDEQGLEENP